MSTGERGGQRTCGLRVLVVEDEAMVALLLEEMIAELGYQVVGPVARLGKAVEIASTEMIDAAILDINVDGKEVYPVAETLAARHIPFAFVSGYGKEGLRSSYRASPTLGKPFRRQDLQKLFEKMGRAKQG